MKKWQNISHILRCFLVIFAILATMPFNLKAETIILQSTTSTANAGLLDYILPIFTKETGIKVKLVAVGTGQAIKNASNGDGDVLLVHAKKAEEAFIATGDGVQRFDLMYNDFILLGPSNDPANIKGMNDIVTALNRIAQTKAIFLSRGDDSGTHKKELSLWQNTKLKNIIPSKPNADFAWYRATGSGMGATLNMMVAMDGYTISDRATWLAFKNKQKHEVMVDGDARLFDQYGVILVNPAKHPHVKAKAGQAFIDWLLSPKGQNLINQFQLNGTQLFYANAF